MQLPHVKKLISFFSTRDVSVILVLTFVSLLAIILFIWHSNEEHLLDMREIIDKNQIASQKMQMVNNLIELARSRTSLTAGVIYEEDPFVQDELGLQLDILASRFARLRRELLSLPLSIKEKKYLEKQAAIVPIILPAQRRSVELAIEGDSASLKEAKRLLHEIVNPGQNQLVKIFTGLIDHQRKNIDKLAILSRESYETAREQSHLLVRIVLVFGTVLSIIVVLRVASIQRKIANARDELEVTVRERTRELAESQTTLQTVLDTIPTRVFWKDSSNIFRGCNHLFALDVGIDSIDDIKGKRDSDLVFHAIPFNNEQEDQEIIASGVSQLNKEIGVEVNHNQSWWEVSKAPLRNENNEIVGILGSYIDISERKRIESMKDEFVSTVSHELRTPLTSINGSLSLLLGGAIESLSPQVQNLLDIASRNTQRLLSLINDILDLQKMEAGKMKYVFLPIDIADLLVKSVEENGEYAKNYSVTLKIIEKTSIIVSADENRIMQVFGNLLSNAIKFSSEGGIVEITLTCQDNNAMIKVSDHGRGIPARFRKTLFGKFSQVDASDSRKNSGTGLGLAITKTIVEKHQGTIDFTSQEGKGTTFFLVLPTNNSNLSKENQAANF